MSRNHRNRSWRAQWVCDPSQARAVHRRSGLAAVRDGTTGVRLLGTFGDDDDPAQVARWVRERLLAQAQRLCEEGAF